MLQYSMSIHQVVYVLTDLIVKQHFQCFGKKQEALDKPWISPGCAAQLLHSSSPAEYHPQSGGPGIVIFWAASGCHIGYLQNGLPEFALAYVKV